MTFLKSTILIVSIILVSCSSGKNADEKTEAKVNKERSEVQQMIDDGFQRGTIIISSEEGDCPVTIRSENNDAYLLDPLNLDEKYKKDGEKVWVKYTPLRMANRCLNANPVNIVKIKKRED